MMSLPDCRDIGGEEPHSHGFCPIELFVPRYRVVKNTRNDGSVYEEWKFESRAEGGVSNPENMGPWRSLDVGFVAGCLWGDDSSWNLQAFDLSTVASGKIARDERFGHLEIAAGLPLASAIQLTKWDALPLHAVILRQQAIDPHTDTILDPYEVL